MNAALLRKDTGQILYRSEMGDIDEIGNEDFDWDTCIEIPHKNDLDLGQRLVFEFISTHLPDEYHRVQQIFRRRGAYGRFKDFLESRGLLESWYARERDRIIWLKVKRKRDVVENCYFSLCDFSF
jgi:hypothetical protein